jgi:Fungal domain of unknown function (DUF1746)
MNPASSVPADDPLPNSADYNNVGADETVAPSPPSNESRKREKHVELLDELLRSLDALVFIELSILYYLDCAFAFLILRSLVQLFLLTERPAGLPHPPARSALGAIVGSNLLCTVLHLVNPRPQAGEATNFYMHGSIIIDFVGQLGPTSKWRLFHMDTLLFVLQVVMLGVAIEKRRVQTPEKQILRPAQDLEAEESGVVRSETTRERNGVHEGDERIEMQELLPGGTSEEGAEADDSNVHVLDEFYTGHTILTSLNVVESISREVRGSTTASDAINSGLSLPGMLVRWRSMT